LVCGRAILPVRNEIPFAYVLLIIVDTTREKADLKAITSCKKFLIEEEGRAVDAWTLKLPDGILTQV
jgi:hypothetical protein